MGVSATAWRPTTSSMKRLAVALLVANVAIVVTGGAVRLTASGLGCPRWPRCTDESFVVHGELGMHGFIEFGNRLFTFVLALVALATLVTAMRLSPRRPSLVRLATLLALGIPAQAVLGGVTVLTDLNPWIVAGHLLLSLVLVAVAVVLVRRVDEGDERPQPTVPPAVSLLAKLTVGVAWAVLYVGTVVTGSGPHAGDADSPRTGLNPASVSQLHADFVFLLLGLTVGTVLALRAVGAPERTRRAATWLLGIELAQGTVGIAQYFTDLPIVLVGLHVLGAALVSAAAAWLLVGLRDRGQAPYLSERGTPLYLAGQDSDQQTPRPATDDSLGQPHARFVLRAGATPTPAKRSDAEHALGLTASEFNGGCPPGSWSGAVVHRQ